MEAEGQRHAPSDEALLQAARSGSQSAWTDLVLRYNRLGMRRLRSQFQDPRQAEEVLQQVWETLMPTLAAAEPVSFAALFYTVLKRRTIDELRRKGRSREAAILDASGPGEEREGNSLLDRQRAADPDPADAAVHQEELTLLERAMHELPDHYRLVIEMRQLRGASNRETANRLLSEGLLTDDGNVEKRVENYYYRGLIQLKKQLLALGFVDPPSAMTQSGGGGVR